MERLEAKKINGRIYYYYSEWAWVDGKCRRVWQKYLGKLENIVKAVDGDGPAPLYAEVFQWGLPVALWKECCLAEVVETIDKLCPLGIVIINSPIDLLCFKSFHAFLLEFKEYYRA